MCLSDRFDFECFTHICRLKSSEVDFSFAYEKRRENIMFSMPWRCFDFVVNMICIVWGAKRATQAFNINNSTDSFYCYNPYFMFHDYLLVLVVDLYPFLLENHRKNERKKELNSEKNKKWKYNVDQQPIM